MKETELRPFCREFNGRGSVYQAQAATLGQGRTMVSQAEEQRPSRADAQRNRQKLLDVALQAFAQHGIDASMKDIARQSGVGIGTLYRHFPSREALALAAYQHDLEQLCEAADHLLLTLPPDAALRAWMARFSEYIVTKRGLSKVLNTLLTDPQPAYAALDVRGRIMTALHTLLDHGTEAGVIRRDMDAEIVMLALIGVWQASAGQAQPQASRLLDLLVDGLRARDLHVEANQAGHGSA